MFKAEFYQQLGHDGGIQKIYRFRNGYGASVVRHRQSYGGRSGGNLWELAVTYWFDDGDGLDWQIAYHTPIASDVIGYLTTAEYQRLLRSIKRL